MIKLYLGFVREALGTVQTVYTIRAWFMHHSCTAYAHSVQHLCTTSTATLRSTRFHKAAFRPSSTELSAKQHQTLNQGCPPPRVG
ncbi:hypothetical protein [Segatella buccae]|uniref:hypothetical protein n=1 Tax=Segatella buccae TaxID=28126 RepID=UPI0028EB9C6C|nr:hypothetical protein [Segatella buccae]